MCMLKCAACVFQDLATAHSVLLVQLCAILHSFISTQNVIAKNGIETGLN